MTGTRRHPRVFDLATAEEIAGGSLEELAQRVGVSAQSLYRWRRAGLDVYRADRVAIAIDRHPCEVWPGWFAA